MNDNEKYIEEFMKDIRFDDAPNQKHRDSLQKQLLEAFPKHRLQPVVQTDRIRRIIVNRPFIKLAAAAVIIIGVFLGFNLVGIDGTSVVWAQVAEKVQNVKAFAYRITMDMSGMLGMPEGEKSEIMIKAKVSADYGMHMMSYMDAEVLGRQDSSPGEQKKVAETYVLLDEEVIISVMDEQKMYMRMKLTEEIFEKMRKENGDPQAWITEFTKYDYIELGRDTIDGIEVEGIESSDPRIAGGVFESIVGQVWADVQTGFPVLIEIEYTVGTEENGKTRASLVIDQFEWDLELDASVFVPRIPEDYKLMADMEIPDTEDQGLIDGLLVFAELTGGRYPSTMAIMTVSQEIQEAFVLKLLSDPNRDQNQPPSQEEINELMKIQTLCMFYGGLVTENKDPAYYGDKVTTNFPEAVLVRWKISDDTYKVIYGDLSQEDVSPERLAELETMPLNKNSYAVMPQPSKGALVGTSVELGWIEGVEAVSHNVYLGTSSNELELLEEVIQTSLKAEDLQLATTYYWRVDEVQADGTTTTGDVWNFTTGSMVAHWKFDDSSGITVIDSGINGLDGTVVGDANWVEGTIAGALEFDSGGYVDAGADAAFDITEQITVMAWIKVDTFDIDFQSIISKGDTAWRLQRYSNTNTLEFACTGIFNSQNRWGNVAGQVDVNDGKWHHVAGVYDGRQIALYVDGVLDASTRAIGKIKTNDYNVYIGENAQETPRPWNGLIDDVRIYSYALNADEVAAIYESAMATLIE